VNLLVQTSLTVGGSGNQIDVFDVFYMRSDTTVAEFFRISVNSDGGKAQKAA